MKVTLFEEGELLEQFVAATIPRQYDLLGAALAVYLHRRFKDLLTVVARRQVMHAWATCCHDAVLNMVIGQSEFDLQADMCRVEVGPLIVHLEQDLQMVVSRMRQLAVITATVHSDPGILGGRPVFKGTRLPVDVALGRLDGGEPFDVVWEDYPYLTHEKIELARAYQLIFLEPPVDCTDRAE